MRLFIALCLPDAARDDLVALQSPLRSVRPVPEENLHLTLAFLGEQPESSVEPICEALEGLRAEPVTLHLAGPEVYGGRGGQALALGAEGGASLRALHDRLRTRLNGAGVSFERRRFRPHVTLARLPGGADPGPAFLALRGAKAGPYDCRAFGLFASTLRPDGAQYDALALFPLG